MNNVIFSFSKPSPTSTVVSNRLALFVKDTLELPLISGSEIRNVKADLLIIVNGAFAFCSCLEELARAVRRAERIVWIQNDYTIKPPAAESNAESPFRKAFRTRHKNGKAPTDFWTTLRNPPISLINDGSYYINWNALTYRGKPNDISRAHAADLFYYGAFRQNRVWAFDRYFKQKKVPVSISSTSSKFRTAYPRALHQAGMEPGKLTKELRRHGLGLYIEDRKSHYEFHSPANRFYEMLSAGLPMVFEPECGAMLKKAGYNIQPYMVSGGKGLREAMARRVDIATAQYEEWHRPYRAELRARLKNVYRLYTTNHMR